MANVDPPSLQEWYRGALRLRAEELEGLRSGVAGGREEALGAARRVGEALRGSGATFGFPEVTLAGTLLEEAAPRDLPRILEGVIRVTRAQAWPDDPAERRPFAWLRAVVPDAPSDAPTLEDAWAAAALAGDLTPEALAARLAEWYRVGGPEPIRPSPGVGRIVPPALAAKLRVVPLDEDGRVVRVATADPVDVLMEGEIRSVSGRSPSLVVVPPGALAAALHPPEPGTPSPAGAEALPGEATPAAVLLVDDDPGARLLARAVLQRRDYPVLEASGAEEALSVFGENPGVRLAVVDLQMPGMGGRELVRRLRASPGGGGIAIVVVTGTADPEVEAQLIEDGADDYIRKPLDPRLFLARVSATLRRAGAAGA